MNPLSTIQAGIWPRFSFFALPCGKRYQIVPVGGKTMEFATRAEALNAVERLLEGKTFEQPKQEQQSEMF